MERITLTGSADPAMSFPLDAQLAPLTICLRPAVTVDLLDVDELHPSIVSVLIRHQRQARRLGGDVHVIAPQNVEAARTLSHVGLIGAGQR